MIKVTTPKEEATLQRLRDELYWRQFDEPPYKRGLLVESGRTKKPLPRLLLRQAG